MRKHFSSLAILKSLFLAVTLAFTACDTAPTTEELAKQTQTIMEDKWKEEGIVYKVDKPLGLAHKSGNEYSGITTVYLNGVKVDLSVKVVYDGNNIIAEWE